MTEHDACLVNVADLEVDEPRTERIAATYKFIREFSSNFDQKKFKVVEQLATAYKQILSLEIQKIIPTQPHTKEQKRQVLDLMLEQCLREYKNDPNDLFFFAAATYTLDTLTDLIRLGDVYINQTRNFDSVIVFALRYGNVTSGTLVPCIKLLLEEGVDINKFNYQGRTALDYVAVFYHENKSDREVAERLKNVARLFLEKGIYKPENRRTKEFLEQELKEQLTDYQYCPMSDREQLFYWLFICKTKEFLSFQRISQYVNCDNGEETLLQLASRRSDTSVVKFLLSNKADPNLCTQWNTQTPLELAAVRKNQKTFEEILKHKHTIVTEKQYNNLVSILSSKRSLLKILLKSKKLNPDYKYEKNGNTPLHYAIRFSDKEAIQILLKQKPCLIGTNKLGKCPLDMINALDLQAYLDSCLAWDNYSSYFSDTDYKMQLRFGCLIDEENREVRIISKIASRPHLENLLTHPLIHIFISLKWSKIKFYFNLTVFLQALLFLPACYLFYAFNDLSSVGFGFCVFFTFINITVKFGLFFKWWNAHKRPKEVKSNQATFHVLVELLLVLTMLGSFFQDQFRAYLFLEMALSFLLTIGYHPLLSKWSVMLQKVFKTFTILLVFFSLLVVAYAMGFNIMFQKHLPSTFYHNFSTSIFVTYIMTTGEYNLERERLDSAGFGGYLLFWLFTMSMCLVIINFWTGVAVTDIERIEQRSEISSFKNVIVFMSFIENYGKGLKWIKRLRTAILFTDKNTDVNFYVNKDNQFGDNKGFPQKIDRVCYEKIRQCHDEKKKITNEQEILSQLKELTAVVHDLKNKQSKK